MRNSVLICLDIYFRDLVFLFEELFADIGDKFLHHILNHAGVSFCVKFVYDNDHRQLFYMDKSFGVFLYLEIEKQLYSFHCGNGSQTTTTTTNVGFLSKIVTVFTTENSHFV
jgi:hypothetical protein